MDRLKNDPDVMGILSRAAREIGFDRVKGYVRTESGYKPAPNVEFIFWDNPYFACETEGRIAAIYHDLMREARPEYAEKHADREKEISLLTHELRYWGTGRIALELAKLKGTENLSEPIRAQLSRVIRELTRYKESVGPLPGRAKETKLNRMER